MAELVDALDSKSGYRKVVQVRFLFRAQKNKTRAGRGFYFLPKREVRTFVNLHSFDSIFPASNRE
jgi:hypothetical protein